MRYSIVVASMESLELPRDVIEARRLVESGGTIHLLHTVPRGTDLAEVLQRLRSRAASMGGEASFVVHARTGGRAEETLRLAVEAAADLIVLGAFQPESAKVAAKVVSVASCAVMVVAPNRQGSEREALAPAFPLCPACVKSRAESDEWFCDEHQQSSARLFERV